MSAIAQIVEIDQERDRKACLSLDLKVTGANRELAQWCLDHPRYSLRVIAGWIGCHHSRIALLRKWAASGFESSPFGSENHPDNRKNHTVAARRQSALETNDNSESDAAEHDDEAEIARPEVMEDNILHAIGGMNENARIFNKLLKSSALDREAAARIITAIDRMMGKWRSIQSTLERKV